MINKEVLEMAGADPISKEVRRKRWYWNGHVLRKDVNNDCAVSLGGEEKQRQTQNYLTSHCGEGERQTRMQHMDKSKTGSK